MEQIRSFIAIELPEEIKRELGTLEERLKSQGYTQPRWVDPASMHLTLKFLGDITADRIEVITGAIRKATQGTSPFQLEVRNLGAFPNLRRVQVAWAGISGETEKLNLLQKRIDANLAEIGFPPETRPFSSHLTLARMRDQMPANERQQLGQLLASIPFEGGKFTVSSINLMRSQLHPTGAVYSRISSVSLANS